MLTASHNSVKLQRYSTAVQTDESHFLADVPWYAKSQYLSKGSVAWQQQPDTGDFLPTTCRTMNFHQHQHLLTDADSAAGRTRVLSPQLGLLTTA